MDKKLCPHCGMDIEIRNPSGFCDHLYYPEYVRYVKKLSKKIRRTTMATQEIVKQKAQVVKVSSIKDLIEQSAKELGKALPSHMRPERIVRIALTTLKLIPQLRDCNPQSFLGALFQCAQLGLEPNIEGQAYIIPYGGNAQFQIGYKGYVELFYRHQSSVSLDMQEVCANDEFDYSYGTESFLKHKPALTDRGDVIGYYAVAKMKDGAHIFKFMSAEDCMEHGKRYSKSFSAKISPWQTAPDAMCKKTVLIQLMKLLPKSIEVQRALAMDETVKTKVDADMFNIPDEIPKEEKCVPIETQEVTEEREPGQEG